MSNNENYKDKKNEKKKSTLQIKREPRRIDLSIVSRLMHLLYYNGGIKKTIIATGCNLGYDKWVLYLNWLETIDLIKRKTDEDGYEIIVLSERGNEHYKRNGWDRSDL